MAQNIFEATMIGCQSLNKSTKKTAKAKNLAESKKAHNAKRRSLTEDEEIDDLPDDMIDDAIVVVDPEIEVEEIADNLDNLQAILDATADGEVATSDEYVGDDIYACPICGNNFFSEIPMQDGDTCPVCGETPDGYVLVGGVADPEEVAEEIEEEQHEDDVAEEISDIADEVEDAEVEMLDLIDDEEEMEESVIPALNFEEKRFNKMLTNYVTENYKNAKSMSVKKVILRGNALVCECVILFKSGKKAKTNIQFEGFDAKQRVLRMRGTEVGKSICTESKSPFMLEAKMIRNNIIPVAFRYNYKVTKEGKTYRVSGKTIAE